MLLGLLLNRQLLQRLIRIAMRTHQLYNSAVLIQIQITGKLLDKSPCMYL